MNWTDWIGWTNWTVRIVCCLLFVFDFFDRKCVVCFLVHDRTFVGESRICKYSVCFYETDNALLCSTDIVYCNEPAGL